MAQRNDDRATGWLASLGLAPLGLAPLRLAPLGLAVAGLLGGCACGDDRYCGTGLDKPEFGDAAGEFWQRLARLPETTGDEFDDRGGRLWNGFGRIAEGRGREWDDTGDHLAGFGPWVGGEFDERADQLFGFFSRQGERAADDSCCFFERAWHDIKLAIE